MRRRDLEFFERQFTELREFMRDLMREERRLADRRMDQFAREMQRDREEMRKHFAEQGRKLDEVIAEGKAQRQALFKMMDRLDNGGAAPAT